MAPTDESALRCPECGAALDGREHACSVCRRQIKPAEVNPYAAPPSIITASPAQFSLVTLILVMTLVAVCLGVTMAAPGWGVLLMVLAAPALVRTMIAGFRQKQTGVGYTPAEKIAAFLVSLCVMVMVGLSAIVAFQAVCWGTFGLFYLCMGDDALHTGPLIALTLGGAAGIGVFVWLLWITRPQKPATASSPVSASRFATPAS